MATHVYRRVALGSNFCQMQEADQFCNFTMVLEIRGARECVSSSKIQLPRDNTTVVDGIRSIFLHPNEKV